MQFGFTKVSDLSTARFAASIGADYIFFRPSAHKEFGLNQIIECINWVYGVNLGLDVQILTENELALLEFTKLNSIICEQSKVSSLNQIDLFLRKTIKEKNYISFHGVDCLEINESSINKDILPTEQRFFISADIEENEMGTKKFEHLEFLFH